jgi:hypothetical protein
MTHYDHGLWVSTQKESPHKNSVLTDPASLRSAALLSLALIADLFFSLRQNLALRKQEFSGVAKIPAIVSDRKKGGRASNLLVQLKRESLHP